MKVSSHIIHHQKAMIFPNKNNDHEPMGSNYEVITAFLLGVVPSWKHFCPLPTYLQEDIWHLHTLPFLWLLLSGVPRLGGVGHRMPRGSWICSVCRGQGTLHWSTQESDALTAVLLNWMASQHKLQVWRCPPHPPLADRVIDQSPTAPTRYLISGSG